MSPMSNERKNPEYSYDRSTPPDATFSKLVISGGILAILAAIALIVILALTIPAHGQATPPATKVVKVTKVESLLAIREAQVKLADTSQRMQQLKELYLQYQTQAQAEQKSLDDAIAHAFAEVGLSQSEYDLNLDKREFTPKAKPPATPEKAK